jgi:hypothetical protein
VGAGGLPRYRAATFPYCATAVGGLAELLTGNCFSALTGSGTRCAWRHGTFAGRRSGLIGAAGLAVKEPGVAFISVRQTNGIGVITFR